MILKILKPKNNKITKIYKEKNDTCFVENVIVYKSSEPDIEDIANVNDFF